MSKRISLLIASMLLQLTWFMGPAKADPPLPASCDPLNPSTCIYVSDLNFPDIGEFRTTLIDPARGNYPVPILVRYPVGAPGPRPVVIWNHGGSPRAGGRESGPAWSIALAHAGYVVIHPSRVPHPNPSALLIDECALNSIVDLTGCKGWIGHSKYGPMNTNFVISRFSQIESLDANLTGMLDATKVVVGGWSAGTSVVLANSGAYRRFDSDGPNYNQKSNLPIAFMAVAPFGPDYAGFYYSPILNFGGFQSTSFDRIDSRPFLFVTGKGDTGPDVGTTPPSEVIPEARTFAWRRSVGGNKYLGWDLKFEANHSTVALEDCNGTVRSLHCPWIQSLGTAYVDAIVRQRQEAIDWLASDAFITLTGGEIELHRR